MSTECEECEHFNAATNGYHRMCPKHEWEAMQKHPRGIEGAIEEENARHAPWEKP